MKRDVTIFEISDGRTYGENDMVKADCRDCEGCSSCCERMVDTILTDPYDVRQLSENLGRSFDELLQKELSLSVYDGLILPHLAMDPKTEACCFLSAEGRCTIHAFRPDLCRMFPLGRYFEKGDFSYILQVHECPKPDKSKIKVKKWLGIPCTKEHRTYLNQWHDIRNELQERIKELNEETMKQLNMIVLHLFFRRPYEEGRDFYTQFQERIGELKELIGE